MIGMSSGYVLLQLKRLDIPTRKPGKMAGSTNPHTLKWNRKIALSNMKYEELKDKEWLRGKYEDEGLSCQAIADLIGCKTSDSVWKALKLHKIPRRPEGLTPEATAKGVIISAEMRRNGYRSQASTGKIASGKSPSWKSEVPPGPYPLEFNNHLKREVRERDGYTCQICKGDGKCVHHIDHDKTNSDKMNLITLCQSCHPMTNWYTESWEAYLMEVQLMNHKLYQGGTSLCQ